MGLPAISASAAARASLYGARITLLVTSESTNTRIPYDDLSYFSQAAEDLPYA